MTTVDDLPSEANDMVRVIMTQSPSGISTHRLRNYVASYKEILEDNTLSRTEAQDRIEEITDRISTLSGLDSDELREIMRRNAEGEALSEPEPKSGKQALLEKVTEEGNYTGNPTQLRPIANQIAVWDRTDNSKAKQSAIEALSEEVGVPSDRVDELAGRYL